MNREKEVGISLISHCGALDQMNLLSLGINDEGTSKTKRLELRVQLGYKTAIELIFRNAASANCTTSER